MGSRNSKSEDSHEAKLAEDGKEKYAGVNNFTGVLYKISSSGNVSINANGSTVSSMQEKSKRTSPYNMEREKERKRQQMTRKRNMRQREIVSQNDAAANDSIQGPPLYTSTQRDDNNGQHAIEGPNDDQIQERELSYADDHSQERPRDEQSSRNTSVIMNRRDSTDDLSDSSTPDSDQGIRNQCSFPEKWIHKTDRNSKEEAGRQMELCESHRKERLTPDMVHLHTTSGESAVFSYRNFRDLAGEPYPVEFESEGWPKMRCYHVVSIGSPKVRTHTWLLLQDVNCPDIRYLTKVNVQNWRRFLTVDDEDNDGKLSNNISC
ncbi:hypothetical protein GCK72_007368 [Caenorhabditis remanei]|uniref:Uncharacterized protein n=1 Tax=Caenorhabditis remanei TaxID=31234 RepID=A0A6A5HIZ5_CAERE|nr:hypothetical protein GCK72_007368 [Caenorhabditis remanei]KAF1767409.1 hypothetical protein GCK72_007368 [Caenorhabditis remanei]